MKDALSCMQTASLAALASGRDLPRDEQARFDEHVRKCLACYREYREYLNSRGQLDPLRGDGVAPDGLLDEVMAGIRANEPGPLAPHPNPWWTRPLLGQVIPLAASFVFFALAGMYLVGGDEAPSRNLFDENGIFDPLQPITIDSRDQFGPMIIPAHTNPSLHPNTGQPLPGPWLVTPLPQTQQLPPAKNVESHGDDY